MVLPIAQRLIDRLHDSARERATMFKAVIFGLIGVVNTAINFSMFSAGLRRTCASACRHPQSNGSSKEKPLCSGFHPIFNSFSGGATSGRAMRCHIASRPMALSPRFTHFSGM